MKILQGVSRDVLDRIKGKASNLQIQTKDVERKGLEVRKEPTEVKYEEPVGYELDNKVDEEEMKKSR
jgi:hypothetical protein